MDRKSSRSDEDLDVPINSQVNGRIHSGPIVVELGPDGSRDPGYGAGGSHPGQWV